MYQPAKPVVSTACVFMAISCLLWAASPDLISVGSAKSPPGSVLSGVFAIFGTSVPAAGDLRSNPSACRQSTIVSLAPNLTEIVFSLGQGHRIIGVSDFDTWPDEIGNLPRMGGYFNPDIEGLLRLKPDRILVLRGRSELTARLEKLGFIVSEFTCETLEDIRTTIREIGRILGAEQAAEKSIQEINASIRSAALHPDREMTAMICIGMTPGVLQNIYVSGGRSFHHDLLEAIGIRNVFADQNQAYFQSNRESIIAARPDIILDLVPGHPMNASDRLQRLDIWSGLGSVPAVREKRVVILNDDYIAIPGPRIAQVAALFSRHIQALLDTTDAQP